MRDWFPGFRVQGSGCKVQGSGFRVESPPPPPPTGRQKQHRHQNCRALGGAVSYERGTPVSESAPAWSRAAAGSGLPGSGLAAGQILSKKSSNLNLSGNEIFYKA